MIICIGNTIDNLYEPIADALQHLFPLFCFRFCDRGCLLSEGGTHLHGGTPWNARLYVVILCILLIFGSLLRRWTRIRILLAVC